MLNFMAIVYMVQTLIAQAFSKRIIQHLKEIGNSDYIICGDFNLVLGPYIDCSNYKNVNNPISRELHLDYMETNNVIDPFRDSNPQLKRYPWRRRNPCKQARLNLFLHLRICLNTLKLVK